MNVGRALQTFGCAGARPSELSLSKAEDQDVLDQGIDFLRMHGAIGRTHRLRARRRLFCSTILANANATKLSRLTTEFCFKEPVSRFCKLRSLFMDEVDRDVIGVLALLEELSILAPAAACSALTRLKALTSLELCELLHRRLRHLTATAFWLR